MRLTTTLLVMAMVTEATVGANFSVVVNGTASHSIPSTLCESGNSSLLVLVLSDLCGEDGWMFEVSWEFWYIFVVTYAHLTGY